MRRFLVVVAAVTALSACGGGSGEARAPKAKPSAFVVAVTPSQVADQLGCGATFEPDTTEELYVQAVGSCVYKSFGRTRILTFATDQARDSFVEVAGALGFQYVTGHDYAIEYPG